MIAGEAPTLWFALRRASNSAWSFGDSGGGPGLENEARFEDGLAGVRLADEDEEEEEDEPRCVGGMDVAGRSEANDERRDDVARERYELPKDR